jgi:hypothetical protein
MDRTEITSDVANFREAARHLWNCHYLPYIGEQSPFDVRDSYDAVVRELFRSLVLEPWKLAGSLAPAWSAEPTTLPDIVVEPSTAHGVPILINRDQSRSSGYWDHPKKQLAANEAELRLARFFDFDVIGHRDYAYLQVLIASAPAEPVIVGRWALLEVRYARIYISETAKS